MCCRRSVGHIILDAYINGAAANFSTPPANTDLYVDGGLHRNLLYPVVIVQVKEQG